MNRCILSLVLATAISVFATAAYAQVGGNSNTFNDVDPTHSSVVSAFQKGTSNTISGLVNGTNNQFNISQIGSSNNTQIKGYDGADSSPVVSNSSVAISSNGTSNNVGVFLGTFANGREIVTSNDTIKIAVTGNGTVGTNDVDISGKYDTFTQIINGNGNILQGSTYNSNGSTFGFIGNAINGNNSTLTQTVNGNNNTIQSDVGNTGLINGITGNNMSANLNIAGNGNYINSATLGGNSGVTIMPMSSGTLSSTATYNLNVQGNDNTINTNTITSNSTITQSVIGNNNNDSISLYDQSNYSILYNSDKVNVSQVGNGNVANIGFQGYKFDSSVIYNSDMLNISQIGNGNYALVGSRGASIINNSQFSLISNGSENGITVNIYPEQVIPASPKLFPTGMNISDNATINVAGWDNNVNASFSLTNGDTITQNITGNDNLLYSEAYAAISSSSTWTVNGTRNEGTVSQENVAGSSITASITGNYNTINANQTDISNAKQLSNSDTITAAIAGNYDVMNLSQTGSSNTVTASIVDAQLYTGNAANNQISSTQIGNGNKAVLAINGTTDSITATQTGSANTMNVMFKGNNDTGTFNQTGNGLGYTLSTLLSGKSFTVNQTGR